MLNITLTMRSTTQKNPDILKSLLISTFFLLSSFTNSAYSQTTEEEKLTLYNIELIIFKYAQSEYFKSEAWGENWQIPVLNNTVQLHRPTVQTAQTINSDKAIDSFLERNKVPDNNPSNKTKKAKKNYKNSFKHLKNAEYKLSAIKNNLEKSRQYEVLSHIAWQQPGLDKNNTVKLRVQAGQLYNVRPHYILNTPQQTPNSTWNNASIEQMQQQEPQFTPVNTFELDGTITIVLGRFLHIYTDLLLLKPVELVAIIEEESNNITDTSDTLNMQEPELQEVTAVKPQEYTLNLTTSDNSNATLHGFNIREHRRMRSKELHHIDHPLMGILVKVIPIKASKE